MLDASLRRVQRRNYVLGLLNGSLFQVAEVLMDPTMVLTWFLSQLGASNFVIGLVSPIRYGGWFLPQLFVSGYLQRLEHKLPFYRALLIYRTLVLGAFVVATVLLPLDSGWLLPLFLCALMLYSLGSGLAGIPFMDVVGKVIPATRRGSFFAQRMFLGGILALGASALVGYLLSEPGGLRFPANLSVIFGVAIAFIALSGGAWCLVREPSGEVDPSRVGLSEQIRRGIALLAHNRPYRTFVLARLSLMLAGIAGPFYVVYAKSTLGIAPQMVGVYLTARTGASIAFNLVWGHISDQRGNRALIRLTNTVGLCVPLLALTIGLLHGLFPGGANWLAALYTLVFVASGAFGAGSGIGNMGYMLDIAPPAQRRVQRFACALGGLFRTRATFVGFDG